MSLLGIDLGTSGVRVVAYDTDGNLLAAAVRPLALHRPDRVRVEIDGDAVLTAVEDAIAEAIADPAVLEDGVQALSFSVQGEAVVPVDGDGHALAGVPVSMDRRGTRAASLLGDRLGDAHVHRVSGQPLHPMFSIHKIATGDPGWTGDSVSRYTCLDGFVGVRLGAEPTIDWTTAARTGAFDVESRSWSHEILAAASADAGDVQITPNRLPRPVAPGTVVGHVSTDASRRTGLPVGTPIVAGAHDQAAAFLGAGGRRGDVSTFSLGSSDCLTVATDVRPRVDGTGFASYPLGDDTWITLAGTAAGGWALEWFATLTGRTITEVVDPPFPTPPALLVLPYLAGSGTLDNDPTARGVIAGLTLTTTREELGRAFLESAGFELAKIVGALGDRGVTVGEIRAVGGGSANMAALAARANAAGTPLVPSSADAAARGAALLAGVGIGVFSDVHDLPQPVTSAPVAPDPQHRDWYAGQRSHFAALYPALRSLDHHLTTQENIA